MCWQGHDIVRANYCIGNNAEQYWPALGGEVRCVETKESFPSGEIVSAMVIDKNSPRETSSAQLSETPNSSLLNSYIVYGRTQRS